MRSPIRLRSRTSRAADGSDRAGGGPIVVVQPLEQRLCLAAAPLVIKDLPSGSHTAAIEFNGGLFFIVESDGGFRGGAARLAGPGGGSVRPRLRRRPRRQRARGRPGSVP